MTVRTDINPVLFELVLFLFIHFKPVLWFINLSEHAYWLKECANSDVHLAVYQPGTKA